MYEITVYDPVYEKSNIFFIKFVEKFQIPDLTMIHP